MLLIQEFLAKYKWNMEFKVCKMKPIVEVPELSLRMYKDEFELDPAFKTIVFSNNYTQNVQIHPYNSEEDIVKLIKIVLESESLFVPIKVPNVLLSVMTEHESFVLLDGLASVANVVCGTIRDFEACSLDKKQSKRLHDFFEINQ